MARSVFGGTVNDLILRQHQFGARKLLALPGDSEVTTYTFWTAATGGTRHVDLLDSTGTATTAIEVTGYQVPQFSGPDTVTAMWGDDGDTSTPRQLFEARDLSAVAAAVAGATAARDEAVATVAAVTPDGGARAVGKGEIIVNAKDHGVIGNNIADDTSALNTIAATVFALGPNAKLLIPPGTYKTTGTVEIRCALDASQATISYNGTGTALRLGSGTSGTVTFRQIMHAPRVVCNSRPASGWDGSSRGVEMANLNDCTVHVPFVQGFERGLILYGRGHGTAYTTVHLGSLWDNRKQLIFDADATGWSNSNLIIGGRLEQSISHGAVNDDTGACMVLMGETSGVQPNNNTLIGTSIEGNNPSYYRLDCAGRYNTFLNCRWENQTSESRVIWRATASGNSIIGGYDTSALTETYESGSFGNEIRGRSGTYISAKNTSAFSVAVDGTTNYLTITGWTNESSGAPYTTGNGAWTPRQGRWRISAAVTVNATSGEQLQARLLAAGSRQLAYDSKPPNGSSVTMLHVTCNETFNGAESLVLQIQRSATVVRTLSATPAFVVLHAEWVGPSTT